MTDIDQLLEQNRAFASDGSVGDLRINPFGNLMVIGCVDPRVDPGLVLRLALGEAAIIRNVGGRVTPSTLRTMTMLGKVGQANADTHVPGDWNLVILHHTDCGMTDLAPYADLLAGYFETPEADVDLDAALDPYRSVRADVDTVLAEVPGGPGFFVSGLVYDVATGLVELVVAPTTVPGR